LTAYAWQVLDMRGRAGIYVAAEAHALHAELAALRAQLDARDGASSP
jgi:hypothetical protein